MRLTMSGWWIAWKLGVRTDEGQQVTIVVISVPGALREVHAVEYPFGQYSPGE
jgi:hypothetical protein